MFKNLCLAICLEWHYADWIKDRPRPLTKQQYRELCGAALAWACGARDFWIQET